MALVIVVGILLEFLTDDIRLRTGRHGWFVIGSSVYVTANGRGGSQHDEAAAGPFRSQTACEDEVKANWVSRSRINFYCRDMLYSDAEAIWSREVPPMNSRP